MAITKQQNEAEYGGRRGGRWDAKVTCCLSASQANLHADHSIYGRSLGAKSTSSGAPNIDGALRRTSNFAG